MKKRFLLTAFTGIFLSTHAFAGAPLSDVVLEIQSLVKQIIQIYQLARQVASSANRDGIMNHLGKDVFGGASTSFFSNDDKPASKQMGGSVVPDDLSDSLDDGKKFKEAFKKYNTIPEGATVSEYSKIREKNTLYRYTMCSLGYSRSLVARRNLDKKLRSVDQLLDEGNNSQSEAELHKLMNKLAVRLYEQVEMSQLLRSSKDQYDNYVRALEQNNDALNRGKSEK